MPTLVTIPYSHFCEKARWALDYSRVAYREEAHVPGLHKRAVLRASGRAGSVPVLLLDGDGVLDDSPLIVRWADGRASSDRKLLPAGGADRDEALALERHLDVDFAPHVRRLAYFHLFGDRERVIALMDIWTPALERVVARVAYPLLRRLMQRAMRVDADGAERSRDKVRVVFDEMDHRLRDGRPFLLGDRFGVVDLSFAAFTSPLFLPDEHPIRTHVRGAPPAALVTEARVLRERPAGQLALRMYREHRAA